MPNNVRARVYLTVLNEDHPYAVELVKEHAPTAYVVYAARTQAEAHDVCAAVNEALRVLDRFEVEAP